MTSIIIACTKQDKLEIVLTLTESRKKSANQKKNRTPGCHNEHPGLGL
jgi:hypothetical protein